MSEPDSGCTFDGEVEFDPSKVPRQNETFNDADADIILRSSDHVDFRVSKSILSRASPVCKDMFGVPQPPDSAEVPVVDLTEDSATLEGLLRLVYPVERPKLKDMSIVVPLLLAAGKYQMEFTLGELKKAFAECIQNDPVRAYVVACRLKMEDVARQAAKLALRYPIEKIPFASATLASEWRDVSALCYNRLFQYHQKCTEVFYRREWNDDYRQNKFWNAAGMWRIHCRSCGYASKAKRTYTAPWWEDFNDRALSILQRQPHGQILLQPEVLSASLKQTCSDCPDDVEHQMLAYIKRLAAIANDDVSQVELGIDF